MPESKRTALKTILVKLGKMIPRLGDENREEVATAAGMMKNLLASAGLDFHDLVTLLKDDHMLRLVSSMGEPSIHASEVS
jgi:hypothetical protein